MQDALNEHYIRPGVDAGDRAWFDRDGDRLIWTFNRTVAVGVLPVSRVTTGHTFAVQQLHKVRAGAREPCSPPLVRSSWPWLFAMHRASAGFSLSVSQISDA